MLLATIILSVRLSLKRSILIQILIQDKLFLKVKSKPEVKNVELELENIHALNSIFKVADKS